MNDFEGACPVEREFIFQNFAISAFALSLSRCGGCVVYPYPASSYVFGRPRSASERVELRPLMRATVRGCCSQTSS